MSGIREAVVKIRPHSGADIQIGKVCRIQGRVSFIADARHSSEYGRTWRWVNLGGWGLSWSLIVWCAGHGIEHFLLYDKDHGRTYATTLERLLQYGVPGKPDAYGQDLGLEDEHWTVLPGKPNTPWLDARTAIILAPRRVPERVGPDLLVRDAAGRVVGLRVERPELAEQGSLL